MCECIYYTYISMYIFLSDNGADNIPACIRIKAQCELDWNTHMSAGALRWENFMASIDR